MIYVVSHLISSKALGVTIILTTTLWPISCLLGQGYLINLWWLCWSWSWNHLPLEEKVVMDSNTCGIIIITKSIRILHMDQQLPMLILVCLMEQRHFQNLLSGLVSHNVDLQL